MSLGLPQLIYLSLVLVALGTEIARHGEPKKPGKHNAVASLIASALLVGLLYWGGFFG